MYKPYVLLVWLLLLQAQLTHAWNGRGHSLSAAIAYKHLNKEQKNKVLLLLKKHPQYALTWQNEYEKFKDEVEEGVFLLMAASEWPDEIRKPNHPYKKYHVDHWHYITYKIKDTGLDTTMPTEPNIVTALQSCHETLKNSSIAESDKAIYFSWMVHLMGDIHQPLHCASLFNAQYPTGDRGGNEFWVKPKSASVKLHALWDGALGSGGKPRNVVNQAIELSKKYPKKEIFKPNYGFDPRQWSVESIKLAQSKGYLNLQLKGAAISEQAPELPNGYTTDMKITAEMQICLAGYRLAAFIENLR